MSWDSYRIWSVSINREANEQYRIIIVVFNGDNQSVKFFQIIPINVGHFTALPKQTCMYRMYREVTYKAPCVMWYIKGTADNIIVDLGPPEPAQCLENHGFGIERSLEQGRL